MLIFYPFLHINLLSSSPIIWLLAFFFFFMPFSVPSCFRFRRYMHCSESCFVLAGVYISRFLRSCSDMTLNPTNIHRLALISLVTGAKYIDDAFHTNSYYGQVGGVSLNSLNLMENQYLLAMEFDLFVSPEEFAYQNALQLASLHCIDVAAVATAFHQPSPQQQEQPKRDPSQYSQLPQLSQSTLQSSSLPELTNLPSDYQNDNLKTGRLSNSALSNTVESSKVYPIVFSADHFIHTSPFKQQPQQRQQQEELQRQLKQQQLKQNLKQHPIAFDSISSSPNLGENPMQHGVSYSTAIVASPNSVFKGIVKRPRLALTHRRTLSTLNEISKASKFCRSSMHRQVASLSSDVVMNNGPRK